MHSTNEGRKIQNLGVPGGGRTVASKYHHPNFRGSFSTEVLHKGSSVLPKSNVPQ